MKTRTKSRLLTCLLSLSLIFAGAFSILNLHTVYAIPDDTNSSDTIHDNNPDQSPTETPGNDETNTDDTSDSNTSGTSDDSTEESNNSDGLTKADNRGDTNTANTPITENVCQGEAGSVSWILCPVLNFVSSGVDHLYGAIEGFLDIDPILIDGNSAIHQVWQKTRDITNTIFIIFVLIVIFSQLTGLGINNYSIKRILPRIIVAAILVNLSFFITTIIIDLSNIIGGGLSITFDQIISELQASTTENPLHNISWGSFFVTLTGGAAAFSLASIGAGGIGALLWIGVIALLGVLISIAIGFVTICLRQGVVLILIMIAPLAFVCYLLPNTERWFERWKSTLFQMVFFYPMFSFLFNASKLAGIAIIYSADEDIFRVLLGLAIQIAPLCLSVSLLQMSNTVLGGISRGLNRLSTPARATIGRWGLSHVEANRQRYLEANRAPGSMLRNRLATSYKRRELYTKNLADSYQNRIAEHALKSTGSSKGYDAAGNAIWSNRPNRFTRAAKRASLQSTRTATADLELKNTLSEYGDIFQGNRAKALGAAHGEAFLDTMKQQFRAENIAQGDQSFLLGRYMKAAGGRYTTPYEFNRLIGGATGKLGHLGETTIMGQVVIRSADIERRRKAEAEIVATKFGYPKSQFRNMMFNKERMNDDGYELDADGNAIEDQHYKYIKGKEKLHRDYQYYIGVHKLTNAEITKEEYDHLSDNERKNYKKIRYLDIKDDAGNVMNRVYEDDAGYMKTFINRDIMIGDPINMRYATELGLARPDDAKTALTAGLTETDGSFRRYHSTFAAAFLAANYKEKNAAFTSMLATQLDNGYVTSAGQLNIAMLDSLTKSGKASALLQNDKFALDHFGKLIASFNSTVEGERFEDYFSDEDIANYRNVNGERLAGYRIDMDENGNPIWKKIGRDDASLTVDDQRNFLKHNLLAVAARTILDYGKRKPSPNALDSQKSSATEALDNTLRSILNLGAENLDNSVLFTDRLNPNMDIFKGKDPNKVAQTYQKAVQEVYDRLNNTESSTTSGNNNATKPTSHSTHFENDSQVYKEIAKLFTRLSENQNYDNINANLDTSTGVINNLKDVFDNIHTTADLNSTYTIIRSIFSESSTLNTSNSALKTLEEIILSTESKVDSANPNDRELINNFRDELFQLVHTEFGDYGDK